MIHETFVAGDPKSAYEQAVRKYGNNIKLVSAKQVRHKDGKLRSEVIVSIPERSEPVHAKEEKEEIPFSKEALLREIEKLKMQLEEIKSEPAEEGIYRDNTIVSEVKALFMKKGIAEEWLEGIFAEMIDAEVLADKTRLVSYLLEEIDEALKIRREDFSQPKVMMLTGPTGVGKTTTIAKLAARYAYLLDQPYRVALVNLDSYKVGAFEQLAHYAQIMQVEHFGVNGVEEFLETMQRLTDYDVVLIDTAGMSPYDTQKFIKAVEYVNSDLQCTIEVMLVLAATIKYEDMKDIYKNFSFLNIDSLIITKFDETKHFGTLLNFMLLYDIPMAYFCTGQNVPDDLIHASKEYLLKQFTGDIHEG